MTPNEMWGMVVGLLVGPLILVLLLNAWNPWAGLVSVLAWGGFLVWRFSE